MKSPRLLLPAFLAMLALLAIAPAGASALAVHKFKLAMPGPAYQNIGGMDGTGKWTVRVLRSAVEIHRVDRPVGWNGWNNTMTLQPGDVFEIYEYGAADPVPPMVNPDVTYVVPSVTVDSPVGGAIVSGTAPDGWMLRVNQNPTCGPGDSHPAAQSGGVFAYQLPAPVRAGDDITATIRLDGDEISYLSRGPGDAQCFGIDARRGTSTSATPYGVEVNGVDDSVILTTRTVLVRGGVPIADENDDDINLPVGLPPLPGDVIDVYRPKDAPTPAYSRTVPAINAVFDPGNDLVAVDSPGGNIGVEVCRAVDCDGESARSQFGAPAGRTIFDFKLPGSDFGPFDIRGEDVMSLRYTSSDWQTWYSTDVFVGDLTPPAGTVTLAKRVKLAKLRSALKFRLNTNEAGTARAKLTYNQKGKKKSRVVTLASAYRAVIVGNNTLTLKFSKKGKKLVKKLNAAGKSLTGTVTVTLTDAAGNVTTLTKRTKLVAAKKKKK